MVAPAADGNDGVIIKHVDLLDANGHPEHLGLERHVEVLLDDAVPSGLLGPLGSGPLVPGLQPVIALRPLEATGSRVVLTAWGGDQFAGPLPWPPGSPTSGPSGVGSAEGRCAQGRAEEVAMRATGTGGQPAAPHLSVH